MKLKTLLKTFIAVDYIIQTEHGWGLEEGYVPVRGYFDGESKYEDCRVLKITTNPDSDILFITIKQ